MLFYGKMEKAAIAGSLCNNHEKTTIHTTFSACMPPQSTLLQQGFS